VSLTSQLADPESPLSQFMCSELPDAASIRAAYRAALPTPLEILRPQPPAGVRPDWSGLGIAIDHRLRYMLCADTDSDLRRGAIGKGLAMTSGVVRVVGADLVAEIERLLQEHRPHDRQHSGLLPAEAEARLARACFAAGWYELIRRTGQAFPPLSTASSSLTLDGLLALVPDYAVPDLVAIVRQAEVGLSPIRKATRPEEVVLAPVFEGSPYVGGADADLIAAGLLIDVKSTSTPQKLDSNQIYQLAGYVLLDYSDRYHIHQAGWYQARAGLLVAWTVEEFFHRLGARRPIADLRQRIADRLGDALGAAVGGAITADLAERFGSERAEE
jgi:hypothetical protein